MTLERHIEAAALDARSEALIAEADAAYGRFLELEHKLDLHAQIERTDARYYSERRWQVDHVPQTLPGEEA